jgi:hypothetical protein
MNIGDETPDKLDAGMHPHYFGLGSQGRRCLNGIISPVAYKRQKKTYNELIVRERYVLPSIIQLLRDTFRIQKTLEEVPARHTVSGGRRLDLTQPPAQP